MKLAISHVQIINQHRHDLFVFATHSAAVTAITVDAVMLLRQLITSLPPHSSHIRAITRLHARCLAGPPVGFCNVVCFPLQISIKADFKRTE